MTLKGTGFKFFVKIMGRNYVFCCSNLISFNPTSHFKEQKQKVSIKKISSLFELILSGVLQGSILGLTLFNIFLNDLFLWLNNSDLHNFEDDNTIVVTSNNLPSLCHTLEKESEFVLDWFKNNSSKFQPIILSDGGF